VRKYQHLCLEEREKLFVLHEKGISLRKIGLVLGRSDSSLCRELRRNKTGVGARSREYLIFRYLACKAHVKAQRRAQRQRRKAPLKNPLIFLYVREHLRLGWTPEEIAGRLPLDFPGEKIHHETIYRYIYSKPVKKYKLWQYLTLVRKKRVRKEGRRIQRQGKIPQAISIDLRPALVNQRERLGDWETDNLEGKRTDQTTSSVLVERLIRVTLLGKLPDRSAKSKTRMVVNSLSNFPPKARLTLTADNGRENTYHQEITNKTGVEVYFCHAYHAWEKGTVENTIQRIRRFIPKGKSLDAIDPEQFKLIQQRLNNTPRKCLGYLTPYEKMLEVLT